MTHTPCKRVGNNIEGLKYIFTLPLKDGSNEIVTLTPSGSATHWWSRGFFGKIKETGSEGCWGSTDSNPKELINTLNAGGFILCDSGKGINGHQVIIDKISCTSELCVVPMQIDRKESFNYD